MNKAKRRMYEFKSQGETDRSTVSYCAQLSTVWKFVLEEKSFGGVLLPASFDAMAPVIEPNFGMLISYVLYFCVT